MTTRSSTFMFRGKTPAMDHQKLHMCEKFLMKLCSTQILLQVFVIVFFLPLVCADLNSDKQALQAFAAAVPHGAKLQWDNSTNICTSWVGITCTSDGTRVLTVRLPAVGLTGPIPSNTLGELDALRVLSLRSNFLNGSLPSDLLSLPALRSLFLQHNNFTGNIPDFLPRRLHILDLSYNFFTGNIPATIQFLSRLTGLFLQNNSLSGPIPNVSFPKLKHFNISYNHLNGSIPSSFKALPSASFLGNPFLCGVPLRSCLHHPPSSRKFPLWAIIAIAAGGGVAVLILVILIVVCCCLKKPSSDTTRIERGKSSTNRGGQKPSEEFGSGVLEGDNNKLVFFQGSSYSFDLEDLLRASAEVLGKGSFGTSYKAVLEESTTVVVKRLKEVAAVKKDFEQQMEMIDRVGHHQNVVPLRAYFYSKDEKLLVYDYFTGGSLMSLLHGNSGSGRIPLDWETRIKIALGTAKGIAHIHSFGGPKFTHGNIKSSNVLINHEMDGVISDMGLVPLMNLPPVPPASSNAAGYRAPEVVETKKHSHKSDVYSFGILLLEMLTGKQPIQSPGRGEMVDLPRWVQSVVREEWTAEVFDIQLMRFHNIEEEMMQMLQIGLACVVRSPESRPTIHEVVRMLEQIQLYNFENRPPSE